MWWLIPAVGLILGAWFGQYLHIEIPAEMVKYLSIGIMAALDSVFGGVRALYEKKFDGVLMLSGFFANSLLAGALAYIGDMLSIDLYYAAVFAFGVRLFSNLSLIRVYIIANVREKERLFRARYPDADDDEEYEENDYSEDDGGASQNVENDVENDAENDSEDNAEGSSSNSQSSSSSQGGSASQSTTADASADGAGKPAAAGVNAARADTAGNGGEGNR